MTKHFAVLGLTMIILALMFIVFLVENRDVKLVLITLQSMCVGIQIGLILSDVKFLWRQP